MVIDWFNCNGDIGWEAPLVAIKDFKHDPGVECVSVCVYVYVCERMHVCKCVCMCVCVCVHMSMCVCAYVYVCVCAYVSKYVCVCMYVHDVVWVCVVEGDSTSTSGSVSSCALDNSCGQGVCSPCWGETQESCACSVCTSWGGGLVHQSVCRM